MALLLDALLISSEMKCSLSADTCVHVFMAVHSNPTLGLFGSDVGAPELRSEAVSRLERIVSYPTGQGAALQTNHPPSISLPD